MNHIKYFLLTLLASFLALPATARNFTYDGINYTVLSETDLTCETLSGLTTAGNASCAGDIVIPSKVSDGEKEYTVVQIGNRSFKDNVNITSITLPDSLKSIDFRSFEGCTALASVSIPDGLETIGYSAFFGCSSISSLILPEGLQTIERSVFYDCVALESIVLPDNVTSIGNDSFRGCTSLSTVILPNELTSIGERAFIECINLQSIELPNSLSVIGGSAFNQCTSLNEISFSENLTYIGENAFYGCSGISKVDLPDTLLNEAVILNGAFAGCIRIESLKLPVGVVSIGESGGTSLTSGPFYNCTSLESVILPSGLNLIGTRAFADCKNLNSVLFPSTLETIGSRAFEGCNGLVRLELPDNVSSIGEYAFYACQGLTSVEMPASLTQLEKAVFSRCFELEAVKCPSGLAQIGDEAFYMCGKLTSINFPDGLLSIGYNAFTECVALKELEFPETLKSIASYAFGSCKGLETVVFPESLETIGNRAFQLCTGLSSVTLPASLTGIEDKAFSSCIVLRKVCYNAEIPIECEEDIFDSATYESGELSMPNATLADIQATVPWNKFVKIVAKDGSVGDSLAAGDDFEYNGIWYTVLDSDAKTVKTRDGKFENDRYVPGNNVEGDVTIPATVSDGTDNYTVTEIGQSGFSNCIELTSIALPVGLLSIGGTSFEGCSSLTEITIPDGVASIGSVAFGGCSNLTSISIPNGVTEIGFGVFRYCSSLTSVTIPEGVTSIGRYAFYTCYNLTSINIPDGVTVIGDYAFENCSNLTSISIPEGTTTIGEYAFSACINLPSINIPNGVTTIGQAAFSFCERLTSITIPAGVALIGESAFQYIDSNAEITYLAEIPIESYDNVFRDETYSSSILNMPNATLEAVKAISPWNKFGKIMAADGSIGFGLAAGEDFEYEGIWYTVIDPEAKTVKTKEGAWVGSELPLVAGNSIEGSLVIPQTVSDGTVEYTVEEIGYCGFVGSEVISVDMPETVKFIGWSAFQDCKNLESVHISENLKSIESNTFAGCGKLKEVNFPESLVALREAAFSGCESLTSIILPDGIASFGGAVFDECSGLTTVKLPSTLHEIGPSEFRNCTGLKSIEIPESLTAISNGMFYGCTSLEEILLPNTIETIEILAFGDCVSLRSLNLPSSLKVIENAAFAGCSALTNVDIPAGVTDLRQECFRECGNISSVMLPASLTLVKDGVFRGDDNILEVTYLAPDPLAADEWVFTDATYTNATLNMPNATLADVQERVPWNKFSKIVAKDGSKGFVANGDDFEYEGMTYTVIDAEAKTCKTKDNWYREVSNIPDGFLSGDFQIPAKVLFGQIEYSVVEIGYESFYECGDLTSVILPETLNKIGSDAFYHCEGLTSVVFPDKLSVIGMGAFMNCSLLSNLQLPENLSIIDAGAFSGCQSLTAIDLPESLVEIGSTAFAWCRGLESIVIPESITKIENRTFYQSTNLKSVVLPETVDTIGSQAFSLTNLSSINLPNSLHYIGSSCFYATDLTNVVIPENVDSIQPGVFTLCNQLESIKLPESCKFIGDGAFSSCYNLQAIEFPSSLVEIGSGAFRNCILLDSIVLPEGFAELGEQAFSKCNGLKSVYLPASINSIGDKAFIECDSIKNVHYSTVEPIESANDIFTSVAYATATLNMPNAALTAVQATVPWNKFLRINAKDGSVGLVADGDEFEYQGMTYTVIVAEDRTVRTKVNWYHHTAGIPDEMFTEDFEIPAVVNDGINAYTVIEIGAHTFDGCEPLTAIKLPETIKTIDMYAFEGCIHLNSIDIPDGVMYIGTRAFASCSSLHSVEIPASVTGMGESVFRECKSLQEAILPDGLITIPVEMFHDCANLVSVNYPSSLISIRDYAFYGCQSLTSVMLPESLTSIGVLAFTGCLKFKELSLPDSLEEIGEKAFWGCDLTTLTLPASLTSIGSAAFDRNQNIAEVTYNATQPITAPEDIFDTETADIYATATLKTPNATLEAVQATVPWNKFLRITASNDSIVPFVTEIILTKTFAELKVGETLAIEATLLPANATDKRVTWTSDKPEIAKVDSVGKVTAIALGEATITATCGEVNATCKVTVVPTPVAGITLSAESLDLIEGDSAKLTVTLVPEDATDQTVTWTSSDEAVATVSADGEVTAVSPGTVAVSATTSNGLTATCTVTVEARIIDATGLTLNTTTAELKVGESVSLEATVIPEDATDKTVTWASDNAEVAIVDADGMVTAIALGQANITATCGEVSATCKVTVVPTPVESITLSTASLTLLEGEAATLTATVSPEDATDKRVTWTTSDASVATVSADGVVTAVKVGTATVTATAANGMTATCNAKVYLNNGGEFEYGGLSYTVTDAEEHTVKTKAGNPEEGMAGNTADGDLVIPSTVTVDGQEYTVTEIGDYGFSGNSDLLSVTIPGSVTNIGTDAFADCERLTSLIWLGNTPLQSGVVEGIGNPNLLVYVNSPEAAPEGMGHNVVVGSDCDNLVLTPGYPFYPAETFFSKHSEMSKSFTQETPIGGSAGWETLAVPFHPTSITAADGRALVSFRMLTDITTECPFWLYEADPDGEWMAADSIRQGVPFLISMPNNDEYDVQYRVEGAVTFVSDEYTLITPTTCTPYVTTWASGREFRSLWLPLTEAEAANAMGLNVGIDDLTDDDGQTLLPGSAFHADVLPVPMEAYVNSIDSRRAMPVRGGQNFVGMMAAEGGLRIAVSLGSISILSDHDRTLDVVSPDGVAIKRAHVKAGKEYRIEHLTRGIYIVAGRKITVR